MRPKPRRATAHITTQPGRRPSRPGRRQAPAPLAPQAAIEFATGAFGLVSLAIFDQVGALTAGRPLPAVAAVNLGRVLVTTLLMGATLPLLVGHLARRSGNVATRLARSTMSTRSALVPPASSASRCYFRSPARRVRSRLRSG